MRSPSSDSQPLAVPEPPPTREVWESPGYELICLACEISSYAPDGDPPLF